MSADIHERELNIVLLLEKCEIDETSGPCVASARNCRACTVVRCGRNGFNHLFPPAFVNLQITQVDRQRILE